MKGKPAQPPRRKMPARAAKQKVVIELFSSDESEDESSIEGEEGDEDDEEDKPDDSVDEEKEAAAGSARRRASFRKANENIRAGAVNKAKQDPDSEEDAAEQGINETDEDQDVEMEREEGLEEERDMFERDDSPEEALQVAVVVPRLRRQPARAVPAPAIPEPAPDRLGPQVLRAGQRAALHAAQEFAAQDVEFAARWVRQRAAERVAENVDINALAGGQDRYGARPPGLFARIQRDLAVPNPPRRPMLAARGGRLHAEVLVPGVPIAIARRAAKLANAQPPIVDPDDFPEAIPAELALPDVLAPIAPLRHVQWANELAEEILPGMQQGEVAGRAVPAAGAPINGRRIARFFDRPVHQAENMIPVYREDGWPEARNLPETAFAPPPAPSQKAPMNPPSAAGGRVIAPDAILGEVLNLLPDVDQEYATDMIKTKILVGADAKGAIDQAIHRSIEMLLDIVGGYPKAVRVATGGKRKLMDWDMGEGSSMSRKKVTLANGETVLVKAEVEEIDYTLKHVGLQRRCGGVYLQKSLAQLERTFLDVSVVHIRQTFNVNNNLYVPAHVELYSQSMLPVDERPYKSLRQPREPKEEKAKKPVKSKGKAKRPAKRSFLVHLDEEGNEISTEELPPTIPTEVDDGGEQAWADERLWLLASLRNKGTAASWTMHRLLDPPKEEPTTVCGCCFDTDHIEYMAQCEEGHLFCASCIEGFISSAIGDSKATIHCMDCSGCTARFLDSQLRKAVPYKTLNAFHALVQANELEAAGIEGFSMCPHCNYGHIIENPDERLFKCQSSECGMVTCRFCRRKEHLPRSCAEAVEDNKLDKRHNVEEAMTEALVRKCPGCKRGYLKETGCNKITCQHCGVVSCYLCQKDLNGQGYGHFDQQPGDYGGLRHAEKCRLWDQPAAEDNQDRERVAAARGAAQRRVREEAEQQGLQLEQALLDVELPGLRAHPAGIQLPRNVAGQPGGFGLDMLYNPLRELIDGGRAPGLAVGLAAALGAPGANGAAAARMDFENRNPGPGQNQVERLGRNHENAHHLLHQQILADVGTLLADAFPIPPGDGAAPHLEQEAVRLRAEMRFTHLRHIVGRGHSRQWPDQAPAVIAAYALEQPNPQLPAIGDRRPGQLNPVERFYFKKAAVQIRANQRNGDEEWVMHVLNNMCGVLRVMVYQRIAGDPQIIAPQWLRDAAMDWRRVVIHHQARIEAENQARLRREGDPPMPLRLNVPNQEGVRRGRPDPRLEEMLLQQGEAVRANFNLAGGKIAVHRLPQPHPAEMGAGVRPIRRGARGRLARNAARQIVADPVLGVPKADMAKDVKLKMKQAKLPPKSKEAADACLVEPASLHPPEREAGNTAATAPAKSSDAGKVAAAQMRKQRELFVEVPTLKEISEHAAELSQADEGREIVMQGVAGPSGKRSKFKG